MKSHEIRASFREFFTQNGHENRPSAPLVPASDPSVLLTTAGMQQFKPFFLGIQPPPHPRLTTCQKCFRTTDIDNVGKTARHLTFFEMLGNFSFGDYFKEGAIDLAWRYSTGVLGLDAERIWVSIFAGDDNVAADDEARETWLKAGLPPERIIALPAADNFWSAGPTGPCGPCTELYFDLGAEAGCGRPDCAPGCDCDRFVEFWNLVFMQFDRDEAGALTPLPRQNVDTGMGLERISAVIEGKLSVFETDLFKPLIDYVCETIGVKYGAAQKNDRAIRVLADHARAIAFLVADGVFADNEGRGYVLRRVMRRAIQAASALAAKPPFLAGLCSRVVELMQPYYPELGQAGRMIAAMSGQEEERFGITLAQGNDMLTEAIVATKKSGGRVMDGEIAFRLHDTYGFPYDLTSEIVHNEGLEVDEEGFDRLMDEQRRRARASIKTTGGRDLEALAELGRSGKVKTEFVGYGRHELYTSIGDLRELGDGRVLLKLRESPFYAESGGQISDTGWIHTDDGKADVLEVLSLDGDQAVLAEVTEGRLEAGARAKAMINRVRRHATSCNHSATHLLQNALRQLLGEQVRQAGSAVGPEKLRFDFSYGEGVSDGELARIEDMINRKIIENHPVKAFTTTLEYARDMGAIALFDEKYGDFVRVIEIGDFSRELCGGTHVSSTAQIGAFRIVSESSVGANLRRIEAITSRAAIDFLRRRALLAEDLARELKTEPESILAELAGLRAELERLGKLEKQAAARKLREHAGKVKAIGIIAGVNIVTLNDDKVSVSELPVFSDLLKERFEPAAIFVTSTAGGRISMIANISQKAVDHGVHAGDLIKEVAPLVGGKGGGRANLARGSGADAGKAKAAHEAARKHIAARLGASS